MRHPHTLALTLFLAAPAALAQQAGTVQDVVINGTSDLLSNYVKATLNVQPGAALSSVNLRQVEQDVLATGYFRTATAELRTIGGRDTLVITVTPNPTIASVDATGLTFLPAEGFKKSIADLLNVAPGATLNTQRLDQAKEALAQNYRSEGFPFTPSISATTKTNKDGTVAVSFVVDETAPISRVEVEGVSLLPAQTVTNIFKPLYDARKFTVPAYYNAVQQLQQAYDAAGYLQSGVNLQASTLENGVLKVRVVEGKAASVNLDGIEAPGVTLQTKPGQPLSLERLRADVRTLANKTGKPVGFALQPDPQNPGQVAVYFGAADVASGPVKQIVFKGNTQVPTATLAAAIKTKVGDVYSPQLAQEDFLALRDAYRKAGYELSTRDAITFNEGTLTFNIREVKLAGYELQWQGKHNTKDRVVLRELPAAGHLFNLTELREGLARVSRLGFVQVVGENVRSDPQNPESVTYVLTLAESNQGIPVSLGLQYDSMTGFAGDVAYSNPNAFGLGHNFSVQAGAQQNDAGQNLFGNVSYTIPWLDLNFLDFRTNRTSLGATLGSQVAGNLALMDKSSGTAVDTGRQYTVRTSGFSVRAGRDITKYLSASLGTGFSYRTYFLEPLKGDETSNYTDEQATNLLTPTTRTTSVSASLNYDSTDNPEFPSRGVRANTDASYNFGASGSTPVSWTDVQAGASTYLGLGRTLDKGLGIQTRQQVFAVRANAGTIGGNPPTGTGYNVGGGSSPAAAYQLRGLDNNQLFGTNYFTASAEYRYDFNLTNSFTQGLYGVAFVDAGDAWNNGETFKLNYGVGAGVQLNLGFGGARLPSLRFDYGYSPQNGSGKFYFRIGNFF
ncbi:outer membrane protein assembly factor [Deinococcus metallilatus]|uniref:Outer membrane protein assembly factor n=1 Tax=Deinococcus metallilatus TaxID=1211322 RepID=A0AAJ5F3B8_9DEIO|nr:POTRA domain-containing protein [Deinococcus metallilatus]MBB5296564.1 outer membrane protein assembly factor BamA [Deinococcus metallilatus]QBY08412.1 outer membrane protein assembly factor [Deinococcus metallilatus]RXJ11211.1 outer membrane protein assembly factor [Deinococcus metallilatus]TLK24702.1 outer membrane protein assembly factor [Deinococcus metallilatus]GMA17481.1 outer membrane protein [Deinococcus metallilatus]